MAVGGGAEGLIYATRQWVANNRGEIDSILLQKDMKNAINVVQSVEFLHDYRHFTPILSRFAEFCYASESNLVLNENI